MDITKELWMQGLLLSHGSTWSQAKVYLVHYGDQKIIVKDFTECPCLVRALVCKYALRREVRALTALDGLNIAPRLLQQMDEYAYAMSYVDAEPFNYRKHITSIDVLQRLQENLRLMHQQGVVHNDLRGANILVTVDGDFRFIDFGTAYFYDENTTLWARFKNYLFELCKQADQSKVISFMYRFDPSALTKKDRELLRFKTRIYKLTRLWKKLINKPLLRKNSWEKRKAKIKSIFTRKPTE